MSLATSQNLTTEAEERRELQAVLNSDILKKAHNLQHFLEFVAEKYFSGASEEIKEYTIAIQALHRPENFDPQADTIVRVTAHSLRKKLEQYYATEGANHAVQIQLPPGKYVLLFRRNTGLADSVVASSAPVTEDSTAFAPHAPPHVFLPQVKSHSPRHLYALLLCCFLLVLAGVVLWNGYRHRALARPDNPAPRTMAALDKTVRIHFGAGNKPYVDAVGRTWIADGNCKGGTPFAHPGHEVQGTDDPSLFQNGREGRFRCIIPVAPGTYQLELLFADTAGDKVAVRQTVFAIDNQLADALDIVDEAAGNDVAVGKVYPGIHPMNDGAIHLDFISDAAFVNALEVVPTELHDGRPLRMLAGPAAQRDDAGNLWEPERFYSGGRRAFHAGSLPKRPNSNLFDWERYGHFSYRLPVLPNKEYEVSMYFAEGWFGAENGGSGGIGSRVFDVYCNGTTLLTDFDILKEQKNGSVVMIAHHVKPTPHGALEISFAPVKNYPLINAIEVQPEPPSRW